MQCSQEGESLHRPKAKVTAIRVTQSMIESLHRFIEWFESPSETAAIAQIRARHPSWSGRQISNEAGSSSDRFKPEDDWFKCQLERDARFLRRIEHAKPICAQDAGSDLKI
jgi:hypothetical protein